MMRIGLILTFILYTYFGIAQSPSDQIIVFIQKGELISDHFIKETLPEVKDFAEKQGMQLQVIDSKELGAPEEITLTPQLVFQNHLGRSFYKGRYAMMSKISNFIRTAKRVPQKFVNEVAGKDPVWKSGKTLTRAKIKITDPSGDLPSNFDGAAFTSKARKALNGCFKHFKVMEQEVIEKTDRTFYMNFYPYIADGNLSVSMELFSMFNCIKPIHVQFDQPITGKLKDAKSVWKKAALYLEQEVVNQLTNLKKGDAYELVDSKIKVTNWSSLKLELPPKPSGENTIDASKYELSKSWEVAGPIDEDTPLIQFSFLAPVDHYAGEVAGLSGTMTLDEEMSYKKVKGTFSAEMTKFTMGDESLDEYLIEDFKVFSKSLLL